MVPRCRETRSIVPCKNKTIIFPLLGDKAVWYWRLFTTSSLSTVPFDCMQNQLIATLAFPPRQSPYAPVSHGRTNVWRLAIKCPSPRKCRQSPSRDQFFKHSPYFHIGLKSRTFNVSLQRGLPNALHHTHRVMHRYVYQLKMN